MGFDRREFRILRKARKDTGLSEPLFTADTMTGLIMQAREASEACNRTYSSDLHETELVSCALIHMAYQTVLDHFLMTIDPEYFARFSTLGKRNQEVRAVIQFFAQEYPAMERTQAPDFIEQENQTRGFFICEVILSNPAMMKALGHLMASDAVKIPDSATSLLGLLGGLYDDKGEQLSRKTNPEEDIFGYLSEPARLFPDDLEKQLGFIQKSWGAILGDSLILMIEKTRGMLKEGFSPKQMTGPGPAPVPDYTSLVQEYESFSDDRNWMPNVVMIAKNALVWLYQLSKAYGRNISTLDAIPNEELDKLKDSGFNALWLIGLWERSESSRRIKNLCGNPEAAASAYSIRSYSIAQRLGSWTAFTNLRQRCEERGIRLASDMVPNHTGLDSEWMKSHSEYFIRQPYSPFPSYTFNGPDLSGDPDIEIKIEDHYYSRSDAAVVFRRTDRRTGAVDYIFHGNDGTTMPWNDTAQLDYLNKDTREAVIQQILNIARNFHIIRFDAAMTLARKHIRRLWYPQPGDKPDIAGRGAYAMSDEQFDKAMPVEFWREVVDRVAAEVPDTLLLAEAFWMMEGYFVRTLGMHRVYNSAFMNMLRDQENQKFRSMIKSTLLFDPEILKRYVNFMNNPDEEPAIVQFGNGDKYFGICTLLATLPGLPMFGHGQIQGFSEKYGMEYTRAYRDEKPDEALIKRHMQQIFPLLKKRSLFSGCDDFQIFDARSESNHDRIEESVIAYANGNAGMKTLVIYNNQYERCRARIHISAQKLVRHPDGTRAIMTTTVARALDIPDGPDEYTVARWFGTRLSYLIPCREIHRNGLPIDIEGFQTKVFIDIRTMKDRSGILARLHAQYKDSPIEDFQEAFGKAVLSPMFSITMDLLKSDYPQLIRLIIDSKLTPARRRKLSALLEELHRNMLSLEPQLAMVGIKPMKMSGEQIESDVRNLERLLSKPFFRYACQLNGHESDILTSFLFLQPFVDKSKKLADLLRIADALMLPLALGATKESVHLGALMCLREQADIETLLDDRAFRSMIGVNLYEGVVWFRSEAFIDAALSCLAANALAEKRLNGMAYEKKLDFWLDKVRKSNYILDNLCAKD